MSLPRERFSNFVCYFIYGLFALFTAIILVFSFLGPRVDYFPLRMTIMIIAGLLILLLILKFSGARLEDWLEQLGTLPLVISLFLICLALKLTFVFVFQVEPYADSATFFNTAAWLSQGEPLQNARYIALFPHIFGYSSFLSFFFKLFGATPQTAAIVNAVLSSLSIFFLYYIGKTIISKTGAAVSCLIWILLPSQSFYNISVVSEPLYTFELLIVFSLIIFLNKRLPTAHFWFLFGMSFLLSLFLLFVNMARPIAYIPIIALFIWFFCVDIPRYRNRKLFIKKLGVFVAVLVFFFTFSSIENKIFESVVGEAPATVPGYNIHVGLNMDSYGTWNLQDSQLLSYYSDLPGRTAVQAQQEMMKEALTRLTEGNIQFPSLLYHKFLIFWVNDSSAIGYYSDVLPYSNTLEAICNAYYFILVLLSLFGAIVAILKKEKSEFFLICIYMIGLTLAQMLVEVAPRYHYSGLLTFTLLGAYGLVHLNHLLQTKTPASVCRSKNNVAFSTNRFFNWKK